jgi:ankyrin repeat protein
MVDFLVQCQPHTASIPTTKQKLALHFAAGDGHTNVVQTLLQAYPEGASMPSAKGKIPLHFAARWGHLQIARELLQVYPEGISTLDWEGSLPLHDAAREGQYEMAAYLIDRFPLALCMANLRGEIPLFPAVRSRNLDLVILCVTAWPMGGKHVLQNIAQDDNVQGMGWDMVTLLLHGAVDNLTGCCLLSNSQCKKRLRQPGSARLSSDQSIITACPSPTPDNTTEDDSMHMKHVSDCSSAEMETASANTTTSMFVSVAQHAYYPTDADAFIAAAVVPAAAAAAGPMVMDIAVPRSKSPILEAEEMNRKKPSNGRKRPRVGSTDCSELTGSCGGGVMAMSTPAAAHAIPPACQPREKTFIALHAALECGASSNVIRYILTERPHEVKLSDDLDRLPLHLAVAQCRTEEQADLVLNEILKPFPEAVLRRDAVGRLPLHIAIAAQGNVRIISALLTAYPTAGVEPCRTNDEWHQQMPIHMACHYDCCLSSVYLLLRADPSSIPFCS